MRNLLEHTPDDVGDALVHLSRRLSAVEDTISDPGTPVGAAPQHLPDGVTVGDTSLTEDVPEVTSLTVETTVFLNEVAAYFTWLDPGDIAVEFEIEYSLKTGPELYEDPNILRTAGTEVQAVGLRHDSEYGARIWSISSIGRRSDPYPSVGYIDFVTGTDTTIPAQVTGVVLARGATSIVIRVNEALDVDVADGRGLYQYQVDTVNTFDSVDLRSKKDSSFITAFNDLTSPLAWYARVRAIDEWGNEGPWSAIAGPTTAGGVNDAMIVNDLSAAKITVGVMHGDRIDANTLNANRITTSTLTSADITVNGGSIKAGSPPTTGLLINSQGLRLYSGGALTVSLDAATGAANFSGNISASSFSGGTIDGTTITGAVLRSSSSFPRFETDVTVGVAKIRFRYDGSSEGNIRWDSGYDGLVMEYASTTFSTGYLVLSSTGWGLGSGSGRARIQGFSSDILMDIEGGSTFAEFASSLVKFNTNLQVGGTTNMYNTLYLNSGADIWCTGQIDVTSYVNSGAYGVFPSGVYIPSLFTYSDKRMKKNISPLVMDANEIVKSTPVKSFQWRSSQEHDIGWIAQEVPEFLRGPDNPIDLPDVLLPADEKHPQGQKMKRPSQKGMFTVDHKKMTVVLWKAVQELNTRLEALESV